MGATFADYLVTAKAGGKNTGIGGEGIESFLYVISGEVTVKMMIRKQRLQRADTSSRLRAMRSHLRTRAEQTQNCMFTREDTTVSRAIVHTQ